MASKELTVQLDAILSEYSKETEEAAAAAIKAVAKLTVQKLKSTSPRKTGQYASGWRSKKAGKLTVTVYNAKAPGLTHLLEEGHVIRNKKGTYGRTRPIPHIKPVEEWANGELVKEIERRLP